MGTQEQQGGWGTYNYGMPLHFKGNVFILAIRVVLYVLEQKQHLTKAVCNLAPQLVPSSSKRRVVGERYVPLLGYVPFKSYCKMPCMALCSM